VIDPYQPPPPESDGEGPIRADESPAPFVPRLGTYILLFFLIVLWPIVGLSFLFIDNAEINWELYDPVLYIYLPTLAIQWFIFLAVTLGIIREGSNFKSIGFVRFKFSDILYAVLFLLVSNFILAVLQAFLALFGLTISKDVDVLVEQASNQAWWWLAVSVTAAICEETAFRGYILTRLKFLMRRGGWILPVFLSTLSFASGHSYQGVGGFILLFVYGLLFCLLYLRTKSLWPCILAHFIQDFSAIFIYKYYKYLDF
jgi:membrane protease YdiL (CAAX protease family)